MPKGNPAGYLRKPKPVKRPKLKPKKFREAETTKELKRKLEERRKKSKG